MNTLVIYDDMGAQLVRLFLVPDEKIDEKFRSLLKKVSGLYVNVDDDVDDLNTVIQMFTQDYETDVPGNFSEYEVSEDNIVDSISHVYKFGFAY